MYVHVFRNTNLRMTSDPGCLVVMVMVKMEWEREELWFMAVSATLRQVEPCGMNDIVTQLYTIYMYNSISSCCV